MKCRTEISSRRHVLKLVGAIPVGLLAGSAAAQQCPPLQALTSPKYPSSLENGDLLWTKTPGRYIFPFSDNQGNSTPEAVWQSQRKVLVQELAAKPNPTNSDAKLLTHLRSQDRSYAEFRAVYINGHDPEGIQPFGGTVADIREHVGHVAIVERDPQRGLNVIEAVIPNVARTPFNTWLEARQNQRIWHMQVKADANLRSNIPVEAAKFIGHPYSLGWTRSSYSLDDERDFYCSKLVWLAVKRATALLLDGRSESERLWPLSPFKLLVANPRLVPILDQGDYRSC